MDLKIKTINILNSYKLDESNPIYSSGSNIGNSYICFAIEKHLSNHFKILDYDNLDSKADIFLFNCQDNLRIDNDSPLKLPVNFEKSVFLSLGINNFPYDQKISFDQKVLSNLKVASDFYPIGVRGFLTHTHLESLGIKSLEVGCPTFFLRNSLSLRTIKEFPKNSEILIAGDYSGISSPGGFFSQGDYDINVTEEILQSGDYRSNYYVAKNGFFNRRKLYLKSGIKAKYYYYVNNFDSSPSFFSNYKLFIGSRVHGAIMAINAGLPAVVTNYDLRAIELCNYLSIPHIAFLPPIHDPNFIKFLNLKLDHMIETYFAKRSKFINFLLNINNI